MSTNPEEILSDVVDGFLGPEEEEEQQEVAAEEAGDDLGEEAEEEAADEGEGEEVEAVAEPETPLPASWSKEDKAAWANMTPEARAVVARREAERDKFVRSKAFEATQTRQQVENQAREVLAKQHEDHAAALSVYAQQFRANPPDQGLLYTGNPDDVLIYQRQDAAYRASAAQQQQLQQAIAQAQAQAGHARTQAQQADLASDAQRLQEQLPEWFDPSAGPELQKTLQSIGQELGYPDELMQQASSTDILALKVAAEWKADAEKYRAMMGKRMESVRAAKGLPKMAVPGVKPAKSQANAVAGQKAWDRVKGSHGRDGAAAADWLEKSGFM